MEDRIAAPRPVRFSVPSLSRKKLVFGCNRTESDEVKSVNDEISQILTLSIQNRKIIDTVKSPSPSYRSICNIAKPPSRSSCRKVLDFENLSRISTSESTESL